MRHITEPRQNNSVRRSCTIVYLKLSFFGLLVFLAQTRKALSRVIIIFSRSLFVGSRSSTQVISWLSWWRRASLLPVDCVASDERVSLRTRPPVPNSWLISSILVQDINSDRDKVLKLKNIYISEWTKNLDLKGARGATVLARRVKQLHGSAAWVGNWFVCLLQAVIVH